MPTSAWELRENDYELLHHWRDPRAGGIIRHKITVVIPRAAFTDRILDPNEVSEMVHKYIPEAEMYGPVGSVGMSFVWLSPRGAEPKSVGTDYYTQTRRAHRALAKMGL